jgi:eukaryotic-like serine/threonine-protein kinase
MNALRAPDSEVGRFRLVRKLGEGGMGEVWSATHVQTRKTVALKLLKATDNADPLQAKRFLREARAASAVRHPNVVQIHDVLELPNGEFAIVMDLLQGEDLGHLLERRGALPLGEVATLMLPVLEALGVAHAAGVVHRDLKPENIFLDQPLPGRIHPKVLDFGIAKLTAQSGPAEQSMQLTRTGTVMGSPYYMSPEQVFGEADLDARSDLWSVGVILYESLSGQKPFAGENFGQLFKAITQGTYVELSVRAPHLPLPLLAIVGSLLQTDRAVRAADLKVVSQVLGQYAGATESLQGATTGLFALAAPSPVDSEFTTGPTEVLPAAPLAPSTRSAPIQRPGFKAPKLTARHLSALVGLLAVAAAAAVWIGLEPKPASSETGSVESQAGQQALPPIGESSTPTEQERAIEPPAALASQPASAVPSPEAHTSSSALAGTRANSPPSPSVAVGELKTTSPPQPARSAIAATPARGPNPSAESPGGTSAPPVSTPESTLPPAPTATSTASPRLPGSVVSEAPF